MLSRGVHHCALARHLDAPRHRPAQRPVDLERAPAVRKRAHATQHPRRYVLGLEQVEQQGGRARVGHDGLTRGDLLAAFEQHGMGAAVAHHDPRDPRSQLQATAVLFEQRHQRVGDRLRAAARHGVAAGRRRHAEHEAQRGAEAIVRRHVHVQPQAREHPPCGFAPEQTAGQRPGAGREGAGEP